MPTPVPALFLLIVLSLLPAPSVADMLQDCRELSTESADIHNCMDNFLDSLDQNITDLELFISQELSSAVGGSTAASVAFERAQTAFREYRRENCLWYLEFSAPRDWAEQIAKNCLAEMSQKRLSELQSLITESANDKLLTGYYVFGVDRNTLQLCGDDKRYWIEGDTSLIAELQQDYLNIATSDLEVMYLQGTGRVDSAARSPYPGHSGVIRLDSLEQLRGPRDGDCLIAVDKADDPVIEVSDAATVPEVKEPVASTEPVEVTANDTDEPEQQLRAYFGAWTANCEQLRTSFACTLSTELEGAELEGELKPILRLVRRTRKRTIVDLVFPKQEIDSVKRIEWAIDKFQLGALSISRIRVDQQSARQEFRDRPFIQEDLLPLLTAGFDLVIKVTEESGGTTRYQGTLVGLTRALGFADDFTSAEGNL